MISITLETLHNGQGQRATARISGRTVALFDGTDGKKLVAKALEASAGAHRLPNGQYDMTYITMNQAAKATL